MHRPLLVAAVRATSRLTACFWLSVFTLLTSLHNLFALGAAALGFSLGSFYSGLFM